MISIIKGNIFTTDCQTIVNTVNCVGVMGAGIAFEFRLRYPAMYHRYLELCNDKKIDIGTLWIYKGENKWVLNFPTKYHWRYESKIEYLEKGLQKFIDTYLAKGITSVAFPLLGASNGGIPEEVSLNLMKKYLEKCDIDVQIYYFDPNSYDDLYLKFKKLWTEISESELKKELKELKERENYQLKSKLEELLKNGQNNHKREILNIEEKLKEKVVSVSVIKKALNNENIRSLSGLLRENGVGDKTIEKAFQFINNYKKCEQNSIDFDE